MSLTKQPTRPLSSSPKSAPGYGTGMRGFFAWMAVKNPRLYAYAVPAIKTRSALSGLGITGDAATAAASVSESGPVAPSIADKIKDILVGVSQAYLTSQQLKAQKEVLDVQLRRAQAGLPPLDINMQQYGLTPTAQVGLTSDTKNLLIWGGAAVLAVVVVTKLMK